MEGYIELIWILKSGRVTRYLLSIDELQEENEGWVLLLTMLNYKRISTATEFQRKSFKHVTDKIESGEWVDTSHDPRTERFVAFTVIAGE